VPLQVSGVPCYRHSAFFPVEIGQEPGKDPHERHLIRFLHCIEGSKNSEHGDGAVLIDRCQFQEGLLQESASIVRLEGFFPVQGKSSRRGARWSLALFDPECIDCSTREMSVSTSRLLVCAMTERKFSQLTGFFLDSLQRHRV